MPGKSSASRRKAVERKSREMPLAEEGQEYAVVVALLGNGRVRAKFGEGVERQCRIRGSMRRREWVHVGDLVLVALRELAGDTADIVFRYQQADAQRLKKMGEPVGIAVDEEEAADHGVSFEGEPEEEHALQQHHRPGMPDSDSETDWDAI